jgi:hypothetical protein
VQRRPLVEGRADPLHELRPAGYYNVSQLVILYHAGDIIIIIWRTFGQPSDSIGPAAAIVNPVSGTPTVY